MLGPRVVAPPVADRPHPTEWMAGASMLVRRAVFEDIGLMDADYFLYFEEIDWATRGKGRYGLAYARRSCIYHKEGRRSGSSSRPLSRTASAEPLLMISSA